MVASGTTRPPSRTAKTPCRSTMRRNSRPTTRASSTKRDILSPPAVEPVQPPTNISPKRIIWARGYQSSKFSVPNPVVVMMELTWNAAPRMARAGS